MTNGPIPERGVCRVSPETTPRWSGASWVEALQSRHCAARVHTQKQRTSRPVKHGLHRVPVMHYTGSDAPQVTHGDQQTAYHDLPPASDL